MGIIWATNNELYHYGVKGMKWGVRRALNRDVKGLRKQYRKTHSITSEYDSDAALLDEIGSDSGLNKKTVRQKHDRAVDASRRMRQMEKDFINKWGDTTISEINKEDKQKAKKYLDKYVFSMPENRSKYSEGAKGRFPYLMGPGDWRNQPDDYETVIKFKK